MLEKLEKMRIQRRLTVSSLITVLIASVAAIIAAILLFVVASQYNKVLTNYAFPQGKLKTSFNASSAISLLGNNINNPLIEAAIAKLPETAVDTGMYVTFDNGEISSYRYEMKINSAGIELSLIYSLKFDNVGTAQSIIPKTFE